MMCASCEGVLAVTSVLAVMYPSQFHGIILA